MQTLTLASVDKCNDLPGCTRMCFRLSRVLQPVAKIPGQGVNNDCSVLAHCLPMLALKVADAGKLVFSSSAFVNGLTLRDFSSSTCMC